MMPGTESQAQCFHPAKRRGSDKCFTCLADNLISQEVEKAMKHTSHNFILTQCLIKEMIETLRENDNTILQDNKQLCITAKILISPKIQKSSKIQGKSKEKTVKGMIKDFPDHV